MTRTATEPHGLARARGHPSARAVVPPWSVPMPDPVVQDPRATAPAAPWSRRPDAERVELPVAPQSRADAAVRALGLGALEGLGVGLVVWSRAADGWRVEARRGCGRARAVPADRIEAVAATGAAQDLDLEAADGSVERVRVAPLGPDEVVALWWSVRPPDEAPADPVAAEAALAPPAPAGTPAAAHQALGAALLELRDLAEELPDPWEPRGRGLRAALLRGLGRLGALLQAAAGAAPGDAGLRVPLHEVLDAIELQVRARVPPTVDLGWQLVRTMPPTALAPELVEHAVLELIDNALRALPEEGGRVRLRAAPMRLDAAADWRGARLEPGTYLFIEVADDGAGIDPAIGDPFALGATCAPGERPGLGLTGIAGWAEGLGGGVRLRSAPGRGTVAQLALPVSGAAPRRAPPPVGRPVALVVMPPGHGRDAAEDALRAAGYRTITAPGLSAGLALHLRLAPRGGLGLLVAERWLVEGAADRLVDAAARAGAPVPAVLIDSRADRRTPPAPGPRGVRLLAAGWRPTELVAAVADLGAPVWAR